MYKTNEFLASEYYFTYSCLSDAAYYFVKGTELLSLVDPSSPFDPIIAQAVENIRPLAQKIESYARQLGFQLEQEYED